MSRTLGWLTSLAGSALLAAGAAAAPIKPAAAAPAPAAASEDQSIKPLLDRLTALSERISREAQSPLAWRAHLEQADVMLQLAARARPEERDGWLRMAVDSHYSAAAQSPANDPLAAQRLAQLPAWIAQAFPGSPVVSYAALQEAQAEYVRAQMAAPDHPEQAQERLRDGLLRFVLAYPAAPEATKAVMDAARLFEEANKAEDARRCYRYLCERYAGQAAGREAAAALWRMGREGEALHLKLPELYAIGAAKDLLFDLDQMRGKLVLVYFWSSADARAAEDFQALRRLTDRYQYRGLEVVYVNMEDPDQGRAFLSGKLTAGVHLSQPGGLDGPVAQRYGLPSLPQACLVGPDGTLLRHAAQPEQLEAEIAGRLPGDR
jgi:hypothetical protein